MIDLSRFIGLIGSLSFKCFLTFTVLVGVCSNTLLADKKRLPPKSEEDRVFYEFGQTCSAKGDDAKKAIEACDKLLQYYDLDKPVGIRLTADEKLRTLMNRSALRRAQNDFDGAIDDINAAITQGGDKDRLIEERGRVYLESFQHDKAREDFESLLAVTDDPVVHEQLVIALDRQGHSEQALAELEKVMQARSTIEVLEMHIKLLKRLGRRFEVPVKSYNALRRLKPFDAELDFDFAQSLYFANEYLPALFFINDAIALKQDDIRYFDLRARLYETLDTTDGNLRAIADLERMQGMAGSSDTRSLLRLANLYLKGKKNEKAIEYLKLADNRHSDDPHAQGNIASSYWLMKMWPESTAHFQKAILLFRDEPDQRPRTLSSYAAMLVDKGDNVEALKMLYREDPTSIDKTHTEVLRRMSRKLSNPGEWEAGLKELGAQFPNAPESIKTSIEIEQAFLLLRATPAKALETFTRHLSTRISRASEGIGRSQLIMGDFEKAVEAFDRALTQAPDDKQLLLLRADANTQAKKNDAARADYDKLVGLFPKAPDVYVARCQFHIQTGDIDKAHNDATEVVTTLKAGTAEGFACLARTLFLRKEYVAADIMAQTSLALNSKHALAYDTLGHIERAQGNVEKAKSAFDEAYSDPDVRIHYQRVLARRGQYRGLFNGEPSDGLRAAFLACTSDQNCDLTR